MRPNEAAAQAALDYTFGGRWRKSKDPAFRRREAARVLRAARFHATHHAQYLCGHSEQEAQAMLAAAQRQWEDTEP